MNEREQEIAAWRSIEPGCDTPDKMADFIQQLRQEIEWLKGESK